MALSCLILEDIQGKKVSMKSKLTPRTAMHIWHELASPTLIGSSLAVQPRDTQTHPHPKIWNDKLLVSESLSNATSSLFGNLSIFLPWNMGTQFLLELLGQGDSQAPMLETLTVTWKKHPHLELHSSDLWTTEKDYSPYLRALKIFVDCCAYRDTLKLHVPTAASPITQFLWVPITQDF